MLSSGAVPEAKRRRLKVEVTDRDHAEVGRSALKEKELRAQLELKRLRATYL